MTLYEIDNAMLECFSEDGEILDEEALEALQIERNTKIEGVALWEKNIESNIAELKAEKKVFEERIAKAERKTESLKKWLTRALNGNKFESARCEVSFRKSTKVDIQDMSLIPAEYLITKEPEANKTAIKKALKEGEIIEGCSLVENKNIQIK